MQAVPYDLVRQLPYPPRGTRYVYDADQVLLVDVNTRVVLDFINISVLKPDPRTVNRIPSYQEQHPSNTHQPPSHSRAYEVAQGKPFTEDEHPSSHGQGHRENKGKPFIGDEHPSSHGKNPSVNKGKPDKDEDHPSFQAKDHHKNKGKTERRDDHPSQHAKNDRKHGQQADKGKPLWKDEPSSDHGKKAKKHRGGESIQEMDHPSPKGKGKQGDRKGGPDADKGRPTDQAKVDKGHQSDQKGRHQINNDRPSKTQGRPILDSDNSESHQIASKGKADREKPKGRGKQKDMLANSSEQEDSSAQFSSPSKKLGKPSKQDRDSARRRSGQQEDTEQLQPNSIPDENIQVAKVERGRGKGKSKGPGKGNKKNRGKRDQQAEIKAALTQQEPAPTVTSPEPATTASFVPMEFDNSQRSIIQSYYQKSGSKRSGKGRGKKSKRNKTPSVARNDILTQQTEPLPRKLESQLPPPPPNTQRAIYNQQVLLIEQGTNRVLDTINVNN